MRAQTPFWIPILAAMALHGSVFITQADKYLGPIGQIISAIDKSIDSIIDFRKTLPAPKTAQRKAKHP
jgi:hypothetical protein